MQSTRLYVLDLGTMKMDRSLLVEKVNLATSDEPRRPAEFVEFPVAAYLVTGSGGPLLFDTGCNPAAMGPDGRWPPGFQKAFPYLGTTACSLPTRLKQLGLEPGDIKTVVLSHMHNDHAGCVEYFGRSKLFVHGDELSAALRSYALHDDTSPYIRKDMDVWLKQKLDWYLVQRGEGDLPLARDVTVLNLGPGHSFGMLGLMVRLERGGPVILTSDAVYSSDNFGPGARRQGVVYDSLGWDVTVRRLGWLARQEGARVWFGHDAAQFAGLKKSTEGHHE